MSITKQTLKIAGAAVLTLGTLSLAPVAQAAIVEYTINGTVDRDFQEFGLKSGDPITGFFSFDDSNLPSPEFDYSFIPLTTFGFRLGTASWTKEDDLSSSEELPAAIFGYGILLGADFVGINPAGDLLRTSGSFENAEPGTFNGTALSDNALTGTYTFTQRAATSVPEPGSTVALGALAAGLLAMRKLSASKRNNSTGSAS
ncbi:PEP-CTERM sorting domain-containing protein [Leptolyngbya sp. FACHB-261]|uniref:PEP-CTERM sorting domain-containing protein n=1 Tax=Leptolyngbya sp. FACHB-261 TaxID=2692806 RepID=UPI0016848E74|nr:PEP-CTERM sorting domain-containing protein [Leptolyngbya sp. FACHB-261]MBD2101257.1 PEP-CTERM sorting domain-containing protein [Leptolyngbya sp. FACHB-261]